MRHKRPLIVGVLVLALLGLSAGAIVFAQTSASFDLSWHVVGSGGGEASSADYRLHGSVGQGVAGQPATVGSDAALSSGYWRAATPTPDTTHLPFIAR